MFEKVRQTGFARGLVGGADFVPDHVGDDRGAMIRHDDDFKPIGQCEMRNSGILRSAGRRRCSSKEAGEQDEGKRQYLRHVGSLQKSL